MDARALIAALAPERARFLRLARSRVARDADAEDIVQRALARAADRAEQLDDPSRALPWFFRILRHAIADHHRGRDPSRDQATTFLEDLPDDRTTASEPNPCSCALRLLAELRPAYADVLTRIDLHDEDPAAVASALGISTGNLHVKLHRARRALQSRVKEHCGVSSHRPCLDCTCSADTRCAPI